MSDKPNAWWSPSRDGLYTVLEDTDQLWDIYTNEPIDELPSDAVEITPVAPPTPDPSQPWPIPLPVEPAHDRAIEAVDAKGNAIRRYERGVARPMVWCESKRGKEYYFDSLCALARRNGWSLRSIPAGDPQ